ncbi:MAG: hypothetical protein J3K34DRAFT_458247 [Monoraphidium minutum]|nr:MAG: hypothetical protein J3K34DRAFT_458247 [Monoraphidium minutum]
MDRELAKALDAALEAFAAPNCSARRARARLGSLAVAAAAAAAAGAPAALSGAHVRRLQEGLASAETAEQANLHLDVALKVSNAPTMAVQLAGAAGMAGAIAAALQRWPREPCAATAVHMLAAMLAALSGREGPEMQGFIDALIAPPHDIVGELLAAAARAPRGQRPAGERCDASAAMYALGALVAAHKAGGHPVKAAELAARCAAHEAALLAAVRVLNCEEALHHRPHLFIYTLCHKPASAATAARVEGLAAAVASRFVRVACVPNGGGWLELLASLVEATERATGEVAAVPGALAALVRFLNSADDSDRAAAAHVVAAVAAPPAGTRMPGSSRVCWTALVAGGALMKASNDCGPWAKGALQALLIASPGALAAAARKLDAAEPASLIDTPVLSILHALLGSSQDSDPQPWRVSAAALPALTPAIARALAACLECGTAPGGEPGAAAASVRNLRLSADLCAAISGWLLLPGGHASAAAVETAAAASAQCTGRDMSPRECMAAACSAALAAAPSLEAVLRRRVEALQADAATVAASEASSQAAEAWALARVSGLVGTASAGAPVQPPASTYAGRELAVLCTVQGVLAACSVVAMTPAAADAGAAAEAAGAGAGRDRVNEAACSSRLRQQEQPPRPSAGSGRSSSGGGGDRSSSSGAAAAASDAGGVQGSELASAAGLAGQPGLSCLQCSGAAAPGGGPLLLCRGCRSVRFCSDECQKLGWGAGHKAQCPALRAARKQRLRQEERARRGGNAPPGAPDGSGGGGDSHAG